MRPIMWVYSLSASATAIIGVLTFAGQGYAAQARATIIENQDPAQFAALLVPAFVFALYRSSTAIDGSWLARSRW